ncbi:uncharacterized protein V6R79_006907 [Siganus canaliculatus]
MLRCKICRVLWELTVLLLVVVHGNSFSGNLKERPSCQTGYYCPLGGLVPVPCPKGTYGPASGAVSIESCLKCPPHHYCPGPGLSIPLPCGPSAHQPLPAQETCMCWGEGQSFQASDGRCHCTIGYQPANNGDQCVKKQYDICRDGKTRTQYGDCLDRDQWLLYCQQQVCQSAEDYQGYDGELGLCVCREPPGRAACGGLRRKRPGAELKLRCQSTGGRELVWSYGSKVSGISGSVLETVFKQWDSQGNLVCSSHLNSSHPVYIVQTTGSGFLGLLSGLPKVLEQLLPVAARSGGSDGHGLSGNKEKKQTFFKIKVMIFSTFIYVVFFVTETAFGIKLGRGEINSSSVTGSEKDIKEEVEEVGTSGLLNPTACLHLGDIMLFTVDTSHYPEYDLDNLYNTNSDFDWGAFRRLKEEQTLSWTPPSFFSVVFRQSGVYVLKLSSNQHKHLYVRVMPAGGQCYEPGTFFPTIPRHMTRMGIRRRHNLLLRPDWLVTGGLLFGAAAILCLCVTLLILFREYGWPEKVPVRARYRLLQSSYNMDDYSSKGSRVISLRKIHRNQQTGMTPGPIQPAVFADTLEEFWDYEHQVDLEAFSSNTFYSLLLKQSLSVTSRLGQLSTEVKELYQGVLGKLQLLHPCLIAEERMEEGHERLRGEVEREVVRRKSLASQLRILLDRQLEVLRKEQQSQHRFHNVFTAQLRECMRLLSKVHNIQQSVSESCQQNIMQRLTSLVNEMGELWSAECQRQGAWGLLGEGTGAQLLCPDTGSVLTKEHIFAPDGSPCTSGVLHCDSVTGLIKPNVHSHILLSSGHTMAVPPDFFLHPLTGRVLPIAGNVAYDPASSTLVCTTDLRTGDNRKWGGPLLPFIPYPTSRHSDQPLPSTRLRGLKPGQRLQLGAPMADPDTGVPVPILAVTIHPKTGLVYPLGGVHVCPLTRMSQPIQIGCPMLDSRTGNVVLTLGVSLDPVTGAVLPVGGVLLTESIIEPLSGRMMRIGGVSVRAGQLLPNAGGYQTLLDSKVLAARFTVLEVLKPLTEEWGSGQTLQHNHSTERASGREDRLRCAAKELQQAWGRSLHCQLQLLTRLELLQDWAVGLQEDGGILGEMPLPGSDMTVPALLGLEYPDPMGSNVSVPVLGCQTDLFSGIIVPLGGTMEDPCGKGLVAIRYGSQTVDPVTGVLAPVVGARLDVCRKSVVPVTASYWLAEADQTDRVQVEALQREVCARSTYWQQQRQREEEILSDLDSVLCQNLFRVTEDKSCQVQWSGRQLREAAVELQEWAQAEAQRRAAQSSHLALNLPAHVLHLLTQGDKEEWEQQCVWHSEFMSGLDKVDVCLERMQQDQEKWITLGEDWATTLQDMDRELRWRELYEQCCSRQMEMEAALSTLHFLRHLCQIHADTAQAVLCGNFWYKEYGLLHCSMHKPTAKVRGLLQEVASPLLERLNQLLQDKLPVNFFSNTTSNQHISGLSAKQVYGLEAASRAWTTSVPAVKGVSTQSITQSIRDPANASGLQAGSGLTHNSPRPTASSGFHSFDSEAMKELAEPTGLSVPLVPEEEWSRLLQMSPLFHFLKEVQLQLKGSAFEAGLLRGEPADKGNTFMDVLDAQWECEGELIPLDPSVLSPREFLVYQHGLFLIHTMNTLKLAPGISLQIAASLPHNNYFHNAFRNSFFYQEAEETLFVRRQRLQSVGGFSLLLIHSLSHIKIKHMDSDSGPAFQRLFFKILQEFLEQLFHARLGGPHTEWEASWHELCADPGFSSGGLKGALADSRVAAVLHKLHQPIRGLLSENVRANCSFNHDQ